MFDVLLFKIIKISSEKKKKPFSLEYGIEKTNNLLPVCQERTYEDTRTRERVQFPKARDLPPEESRFGLRVRFPGFGIEPGRKGRCFRAASRCILALVKPVEQVHAPLQTERALHPCDLGACRYFSTNRFSLAIAYLDL